MHPRTILAIVSLALAASTAHAADRVPLYPRASGSCPADLTGDGVVDDSDFVQFADAYNTLDCSDPAMAAGCPADLNSDAFVDDADFVLFANAYNELLCPAGEVVLRDSIGPDNTLTNLGVTFFIQSAGVSGYIFSPAIVTPSETVALRKVEVVVGSYWGDALATGPLDYDIRVWSSPLGPQFSPTHGDVFNCRFSRPSNATTEDGLPSQFGIGLSVWETTVPTYLLSFDLDADPLSPCPPAVLQGGTTYSIAVVPLDFGSTNSVMGLIDSAEPGPEDWLFASTFPGGLPLSQTESYSVPVNGRGSYRFVSTRAIP